MTKVFAFLVASCVMPYCLTLLVRRQTAKWLHFIKTPETCISYMAIKIKDPSSNADEFVEVDQEEKIANLFTSIISKVQSGKIEDLKAAGLKVSKIQNDGEDFGSTDQTVFTSEDNNEEVDDIVLNSILSDMSQATAELNSQSDQNSVTKSIQQEPWFAEMVEEVQNIKSTLSLKHDHLIKSSSTESSFASRFDTATDRDSNDKLLEQEDSSVKEINQLQFAELLKASIDDATETMDGEDDDAGKTLSSEAIQSLASAEAMQVNVTEEIASPQAQADMQAIMQTSMAQLNAKMASIDDENQRLLEKLQRMQGEESLEEKMLDELKQGELEELLEQQSDLKQEYDKSRAMMEASTKQLETVMKEIGENADLMTTLAMFPIKKWHEKVAFIVGLSFTFQTIFNIEQALAQTGASGSEPVSITLQGLTAAACFNHFGLFRAIRNTLRKS